MFGFLSVKKPLGVTSRQAVDKVKRLVGRQKVGHCGTLDPLASGVLVVCIGPATRLARFVQELPKSYLAGFRLGVSSPTDDLEGKISETPDAERVDAEQLTRLLPEFIGNIEQTPPAYSAVKIEGKRAYRLSRAGKAVKIDSRIVRIDRIELADFSYPDFTLKIECGAGTYIRSIGRDLGARLDSAAVMTSLERGSVGRFSIGDSITIADINRNSLNENLVPPARLFADWYQTTFDSQQIEDLSNGSLLTADKLDPDKELDQMIAVDEGGRLLAILTRMDEQYFKPELNFVHYYLESETPDRSHQSSDSS